MMQKKWKASYDKNRKYNNGWENTFTWVEKASDGSEFAFCKLCRCTILPKVSNLSNHEKTEKHRKQLGATGPSKFPRTQAKGHYELPVKKTSRQDQSDDATSESRQKTHTAHPTYTPPSESRRKTYMTHHLNTSVKSAKESHSRLWYSKDSNITAGSSVNKFSYPEQFLEIEREKLKVKKEKLQLLKELVILKKERLILKIQRQQQQGKINVKTYPDDSLLNDNEKTLAKHS